MKTTKLDDYGSAQRRRWLGAASAAATALAAWAWRGRGRRLNPTATAPVASLATPSTDAVLSSAAKLVVKPAPDSVKRHG
jgi:hypothetical protein